MPEFNHLHVHSEFSLLDGLSRIDALYKRAQELGMKALALTDHGVLYGAIDFLLGAKDTGVKPILGLETYVAQGSHFDRKGRGEDRATHLTLLARDAVGYHNLMKLTSKAHLEGYYYRPRVDRELLSQHSEGLIALSGCASGEPARLLFAGDKDGARRSIGTYRDIFGPDNFYVELQRHDWPELDEVNRQLVEIARDMDLPLVATNDVHYVNQQDAVAQDLLLCIQTNTTFEDPKRMRMRGATYYLKSQDEMAALFPELPDALANTLAIAERCDLKLDFGRVRLPEFAIPDGYTPDTYLEKLCREGLRRRYRQVTSAIEERLRYELSVYEQTGFALYMLIASDIFNYARDRGIPYGLRGSAAGSLVCYCLGISSVDPIANRLVFEQFLNLERREMPDIDMDIADDRRAEMIDYVTQKYGRDHIAQIITFGTLGAKAAIRDVGRALGMAFGDVDRVAKLIPTIPIGITIEQAMGERPALKQIYDEDQSVARLIDMAQKLEGVSRHASTHAAGVIISREPLEDVVPLQPTAKGEGAVMTQYHMSAVTKIGLLKMDFLGLANLSILRRTLEIIRQQRGLVLDLENLPREDERTFEMLARGETVGIFQLEGRGMTQYVVELKPNTIADIAAMVALYRPGPMANIPTYIARKHGTEAIEYPHPLLEETLRDTYGVLTYQDQVLQVLQRAAGYTLGQADLVRKAMGKKIKALMEKEQPRFVAGCRKNGLTEEEANHLWELLEPFAGYGFNRSHAACYAEIAYQTAYLKANFTVEYMTAVLDSDLGNIEKVSIASAECRRLQIPVFGPDVNRSETGFVVEADHRQSGIRFGLAAIKNVGASAVEPIIAERKKGGPFRSCDEFCQRVDVKGLNKRVLESLIKAGAMDSLGRRRQLLEVLDRIIGISQEAKRAQEAGQGSLFDFLADNSYSTAILLPDIPEAPNNEKLAWEKELLGVYVSEHPLQNVATRMAGTVTFCGEISEEMVGQKITVAGMVRQLRLLMTKKQDQMAAATLEDLQGSVDVVVFPRTFERTQELWQEDAILVVQGKVDSREDRIQLIVEEASAYEAEEPGTGGSARPAAPVGAANANGNGSGSGSGRGSAIGRSTSGSGQRPDPAKPGGEANGSGDRGRPGSWAASKPNGDGLRSDRTTGQKQVAERSGAERRSRRLSVTVSRTGDEPADVARFRELLDVLEQHAGGNDALALYIAVNGQDAVEMERPSLRVRCDGQLERALAKLLGPGSIRVEEEVR